MVALVRKRLGLRSVGHAGTLDPFATGLLVVLVGRATRLARFVESERKRYRAVIRFGTATDTDDATGAVTDEVVPEHWPTGGAIDTALGAMTGTLMQRPPAYSAKHVAGKRSHRLARAGVAVELTPVPVEVHRLDRVEWDPPDLTIDAEVGPGTYLRAIARDLGERLGIPAHCAALRRTAVGGFEVDDAIAPDEVSTEVVRSPAAMVSHLPRQVVDQAQARELGFGRQVERSIDAVEAVALVDEGGSLVAVARSDGDRWQPMVVLEPAA